MFKSKGMSGTHLTGTVIYGYLWAEKREHWLVDEEAAEVVRRIFSLTLDGYGPYQIACKLSADRIEIPVVHLARFKEGVNRSKPVDVYKRQALQAMLQQAVLCQKPPRPQKAGKSRTGKNEL